MTSLIPGTANARDLGGLPLKGGGSTRQGVLWRSDALSGLTQEGLAVLGASPVGTIVDLRTDGERASAPDRLPERVVRQVELPLLQGAVPVPGPSPSAVDPARIRDALAAMPDQTTLYRQMLEGSAQTFASIARLLASPEDPGRPALLVHCTAGKDRTGVAAALLLDVAGVRRDAIVADYATSARNLAASWGARIADLLAHSDVPIPPEAIQLATATPPEVMEATLAWLDDNGGSAAYLRGGGLGEDELDRVRQALSHGAGSGK
jgi:protein-tyrosine phosphatase